ncbi:DUF3021 family protein [Butyrivibrio sp. INlla16]|uniref:DUF3021 family protein n=1 Tax=Butyrivibrio sp. INlla16 TaxID=1520807 RepID=UPI00088D3F82|nr:DUF3021 family protein [Butyrivibrio sp. INlla16]SDB08510.1 Protein of unknown function [Butyrivibrio sp. INlla16]
MKKVKTIIEQTMMVSFMVLCYVGIYGLLVMRPLDYHFDWYIPGSIVVASFMSSLVTVMFYYGDNDSDKNENADLKFKLKTVAHFILLYAVIMSFGRICYWYHGTFGFIVTSIIYVIIYIGSWFGTYLIFRHDEKVISEALDKIRDED